MPKRNGVSKTFSFAKETVEMLDDLCRTERRTQTNLIEVLIERQWRQLGGAVSLRHRPFAEDDVADGKDGV